MGPPYPRPPAVSPELTRLHHLAGATYRPAITDDHTTAFPLLAAEEALQAADSVGVPALHASYNLFRAPLVHPTLGYAMHVLTDALMFDSHVGDRLRELIILRVAHVTESAYELAQHRQMALGYGVTAEEVEAV